MAYEQLQLNNQVCFRLYTAARLITQSYKPWFDKMGITFPQYLVLLVLWEKDNRIVGEITNLLGLDTNTITPLLQRMERNGLIIRTQGVSDHRQKLIALTKKGKLLEEAAKDIPACLANNIISEDITLEDLTTLAGILDKLNATLQNK